jgi:hypothetical protein
MAANTPACRARGSSKVLPPLHAARTSFHFSDPTVPPVSFEVSAWRDKVPRIVVCFGCSNNIVFDSATMEIEQGLRARRVRDGA